MMRFGPEAGEVWLYTYKEGLLSPVAHDLQLRVTSFSIQVGDSGDVEAWFDASSIRVVGAMRDGMVDARALTARDRRKIERTMGREVLHVSRHPRVRFQGRRVAGGEPLIRVEGELTLRARRGAITVTVTRQGECWEGRARIHQPAFGIRPYTALLGALRLQAHVDVVVRLPHTGE